MLVGPAASKKEIAAFRAKLEANPRNYIAQPTLSLSTVPIFTKAGLAPRHVDLRPFVLMSPQGIKITPGGLTRVAMRKGSLVVNSSQGGGTKDRSEEHTSELQSLMRNSYAVFCLKNKMMNTINNKTL